MNDLKKIAPHLISSGIGQIGLVITLILFSQVLALSPPYLVGKIIDAISAPNKHSIYYFLTALLLIASFKSIITPHVSKFLNSFVQKATLDYSLFCTKIIFNKDVGAFKSHNVGSILKKSERGIEGFERFVVYSLQIALPTFVSILIIIIYLAIVGGYYFIVLTLIFTIVYFVITNFIILWRRQYIDAVNHAEDDLADSFADNFLSAIALRGSGLMNSGARYLVRSYENYAQKSVRLSFASAVLSAAQDFITISAVTTSIALGLFLIENSSAQLSVGDFVVIFSFISMYMAHLGSLMDARKNYDQYRADILQLEQILSLRDSRESMTAEVIKPHEFSVRPFHQIDAPHIKVSDKLEFVPGDRVAIIGETGGGKSSLLEILSGLSHHTHSVFINGVDLGDLSLDALFSVIFYAPQKPSFLSGDFKRAILFGAVFKEQEIKNHLGQLHLGHFDTLLKNAAFPVEQLSGGEAKRLALLRALTAPQTILFLDEPTAELDEGIEKSVWNHLFTCTRDKLLIVATHDRHILAEFDCVLEVHKGEVKILKSLRRTQP